MRDTYSLYEAKARFSALVRRVRGGGRVVIAAHGKPAAALCPVEADDTDLENRLARLSVSWIVPDRSLSPEVSRVLQVGYIRGPDCLHLATALYLGDSGSLTFLTLDERQRAVAADLGFKT